MTRIKYFLFLILLIFLFPLGKVSANQVDNSTLSSTSTAYGYVVQPFASSTGGTMSYFTFETDNPTYWGSTQWGAGFATMTQCDVYNIHGDINIEGTGSCVNRVRNQADSISVAGNFVTLHWSSPVVLNSSKVYVFAYYGGVNNCLSSHLNCALYGSASGLGALNSGGVSIYNPVTELYWLSDISPAVPLDTTGIVSVFPPGSSVTTRGSKPLNVTAFIDCTNNVDLCLSSSLFTIKIVAYPITQGISTSTLLSTSTTQSVSGMFSFTASYLISSDGTYGVKSTLYDEFDNVLDSTTTQFVVGQATNLDRLLASSSSSTIAFFDTASTTSSACSSFNGIDLTACLYYLFVPRGQPIADQLDRIVTEVSSMVPIGYGFRFVNIIYSSSTIPLPELQWTMPTSTYFSVLPNGGQKLSLTPWNYLMGSTSYLATATSSLTGTTFLAQIMPWWILLVQVMFGVSVGFTVLRFSRSGDNKKED